MNCRLYCRIFFSSRGTEDGRNCKTRFAIWDNTGETSAPQSKHTTLRCTALKYTNRSKRFGTHFHSYCLVVTLIDVFFWITRFSNISNIWQWFFQIKRAWGGKSQMMTDSNIPEKVKPPETNHWPFAVPLPTACPRHVTQTPAWVMRGRTQVISSSSPAHLQLIQVCSFHSLRQKGPTILTLGVCVSSRLSLISVSYFSSRWWTHTGSSLLHLQERSQTSAYLPVMPLPL